MTITAYPFDDQDTTETQYSDLFRELQDSGVVDSYNGSSLRVSGDGSGMNVKVQPGFAIVRGHAVQSTAIETITVSTASAGARVDRLVLRLDPAANSIIFVVKPGTSGSATPPTLTQTSTGIYEVGLALIAVGGGATNVALADVTDERPFVGNRVGTWSTATRPVSPRTGRLGLNMTRNTWEYWTGAAWADLAPVVNWSSISGKPGTFVASPHQHPWTDITDKPATFPPATHTHTASAVTSRGGTVQGDIDYLDWSKAPVGGWLGNGYVSRATGNNNIALFWEGGQLHTRIDNSFFGISMDGHGHDYYNQAVRRSEGTDRAHQVAIGGGGNWYSVWVDGSGWFCRNTSSIRYKENVRDTDFSVDDVLALTPRVYDRKDDVAPDGTPREGRKDELGLIAEEVFETMPELVQFEDGEIDSVRYDLVGVALLKVVQAQQEQIAELTRRLDEMS